MLDIECNYIEKFEDSLGVFFLDIIIAYIIVQRQHING